MPEVYSRIEVNRSGSTVEVVATPQPPWTPFFERVIRLRGTTGGKAPKTVLVQPRGRRRRGADRGLLPGPAGGSPDGGATGGRQHRLRGGTGGRARGTRAAPTVGRWRDATVQPRRRSAARGLWRTTCAETSWRHFAALTGSLQTSGVVGSRPMPAPRVSPPTATRVASFTISPQGNEGPHLTLWFSGAAQAAAWL